MSCESLLLIGGWEEGDVMPLRRLTQCCIDGVVRSVLRASSASISALNKWRMASLNRWAMLEAPCMPNPSRFSDTKIWRGEEDPEAASVRLKKWIPILGSSTVAIGIWLKYVSISSLNMNVYGFL